MNEDLVAAVVRRVLEEMDRARAPVRAALPADWPPRRVALGADHGGFELKEDLKRFVTAKGLTVVDCGTADRESCDYPDFAARVAGQVRDGRCEAGIVVDSAGIGSSIAANKVRGVRCAVCHDVASVLNSREHNDANVLALGAKVVPAALARRMVALWLATAHGGDRHLRRVRKIAELER
jgi:ribose 5-phosphate isomerase B